MAKEPFSSWLTTIWIGAFVFWLLKGFRGKYAQVLDGRFNKRNFVLGYCVQLVILAVVIANIIKNARS